jgi:hypothetical protein
MYGPQGVEGDCLLYCGQLQDRHQLDVLEGI